MIITKRQKRRAVVMTNCNEQPQAQLATMAAPQDLFVTCTPGAVRALVDELTDWLEAEGVKTSVLNYGVTPKAQLGFLVFACDASISVAFEQKLQRDSDIVDYVICNEALVFSNGGYDQLLLGNAKSQMRCE